MIEIKVKYPWGEETVVYDCWEYKEIVFKKRRSKLGVVEWVCDSTKSEVIDNQYMYYRIIETMWEKLLKKDQEKYKVTEYTSNYFEVEISDDEKIAYLKTGHLKI